MNLSLTSPSKTHMNSMNNSVMTDSEFSLLQQYAREKIGIILGGNKKVKLYSQIIKRIHFLKLQSIPNYIDYIKTHSTENELFINFITNFHTDFFREANHFDYLKTKIIPEIITQTSKLRIWSAGCASGEEPYSIAITVLESIADVTNLDIKILATDINTEALEIAAKGLYDASKIDKLGNKRRWFTPIHNDNNLLQYHINSEVQSLVRFKKLNLIEEWPLRHRFDIIFFRNVSIYMTQEATDSILEKFDRLLGRNGILILGHTESLTTLHHQYTSLGSNMFQKV